eukprot:m.113087 g.113087  ORF g.113087 m.113087 type:complete len:179 (+) comp17059_c0_seq6:152-688(+)
MSSRSGREGAKINTELFTLTYGSLVAQLIKDYEDDDEVNKQLEKMGYNIGLRLIDDFLANSGVGKCQDFKQTVDVVTKVGFQMFLGITPTVSSWTEDGSECSIIFEENPLTTFVELPPSHPKLHFSNILCGVLRGALEMIQMRIECWFIKDELQNDSVTEMRMKLIEVMEDQAPPGDD